MKVPAAVFKAFRLVMVCIVAHSSTPQTSFAELLAGPYRLDFIRTATFYR
jgi:hypothetical protein